MNETVKGKFRQTKPTDEKTTRRAPHFMGVRHVGLLAKNPSSLASFYQKVMGMKTVRETPPDSPNGAIVFNLARSEHFFAEEATANGACLYLSAMPDRPLVRGTEPMTLVQIEDRGYGIIGRHSGLLPQRGIGWQLSAIAQGLPSR
jgi:catechol 2,3-dioxygenase-like lactoylglutathione lyase family enzyme